MFAITKTRELTLLKDILRRIPPIIIERRTMSIFRSSQEFNHKQQAFRASESNRRDKSTQLPQQYCTFHDSELVYNLLHHIFRIFGGNRGS